MAEKLQSKVKLRSGEVVTVDHVKPAKKTSKPVETKTSDKPVDQKPTDTPADETKTTGAEGKAPGQATASTPSNENTNEKPKELK